jgi:hypothetical protein
VHVDEVGWRLRVLRGLRRHVLTHHAGGDLAALWPTATDAAMAWHFFAWNANAALRAFQVRVTPELDGRPVESSGLFPTAYAAAVLQLVNDLLSGAEFKTCAAEHCGRAFTRQRGRSTHYNRATGVVYCSSSCANAQAQREYRRRQRAERKAES